MATAVPAGSRVLELDALRGLAALAVVAFHYTTSYARRVGHVEPLAFGFPAGNYGVNLFFLISGYVIFMTLGRTRSPMDFVVSRFSRLYPAYWAALLVTALVVYTIGFPAQRLPAWQVVANLTMVQQVLGAEHLDGSYWTLQVELFFYAQMLFWFAAGQLRRIDWIIGAWLAAAIAYAVTVDLHVHFSYLVRELLILRHIPFFALGILFYQLHARQGARRANLAMIGCSLLAIAITDPPVMLAVALACTAVFALFVGGHLGSLRAAPFALLGTLSYSLYLVHQAVGFAVIHRIEHAGYSSWLAIAAAVAVALVLAAALTWLVERPAMQLIRSTWLRLKSPTEPRQGSGAVPVKAGVGRRA